MKLLFIEPNKTFQQIVSAMFVTADIELGCDMFQGLLHGRPVSAAEFLKRMG